MVNAEIITSGQANDITTGIVVLGILLGLILLGGILSFHWKLENEKLRKMLKIKNTCKKTKSKEFTFE